VQSLARLDEVKPTFPAPSKLARDREAQDRLWRESAAMVGMSHVQVRA